jgi:hypothetical protein
MGYPVGLSGGFERLRKVEIVRYRLEWFGDAMGFVAEVKCLCQPKLALNSKVVYGLG